MSDFSKRLGVRLRALRGDATLRDFARSVGLDARALHRIETGNQNVTLETLGIVCERLNCTAGSLLDEGTEDARPKKSKTKKMTASIEKKPS